MKTLAKYTAVFGRGPAFVREPESNGHVAAYMFPPMKRSFWRGLMSEAHDLTVCITAGLSDHPMPVPADRIRDVPERIELVAFSPIPIGGGPSGNEDMPTAILQMIADYIVTQRLVIGLGHTLDFEQPLATNVAMSAVLFAYPDKVDAKRIMRCTKALDLLSIVPLTPGELELTRSQDVGALLDRFEASDVPPYFDCFRKSTV